MAALAGSCTISRRSAASGAWSLRRHGATRRHAALFALKAIFYSKAKRTVELEATGPHEVSLHTATFQMTAR